MTIFLVFSVAKYLIQKPTKNSRDCGSATNGFEIASPSKGGGCDKHLAID